MNLKLWLPALMGVIILVACKGSPGSAPALGQTAVSDKGMVVTAHPLATQVGLEILRQGGNAADAAIAVQFALAVVYPRAGNLGGGGFMVYRDHQGAVATLDFREKAPAAAERNMFLDSLGNVIPHLSTTDILAAGIPGTVAGLSETYKKYGTIKPWARLVEPAIKLAEKGFSITRQEADRLNAYQESFKEVNSGPLPFLSQTSWKEGDLLVQKDLAQTLKRIAEEGQDGFYKGPNAEALITVSKERHGLITQADLESYTAQWRPPVSFSWRGYHVYSMGPPSSGGLIMGEILGMLEPVLIDSLGFNHPGNMHALIEAERRAYADRAEYLGDSDFVPVPVDSLLDEKYLLKKFSDFDPQRATASKSIRQEKFRFARDHFETTHFSIVDGMGNAASVTTTLNDNYGCKVWVQGGGYFLNNEMDDFSAKPGVPNIFGLIGGDANAIAPGKRMLSSMSPTIIEKNGDLWMVLGSPGGSTIITTVLQVFLNSAIYGMDPESAVKAPRYHHQWLPEEVLVEKIGFDPGILDSLRAMGHTLQPLDRLGDVEAIWMDPQKMLKGVADFRGGDDTAGGL